MQPALRETSWSREAVASAGPKRPRIWRKLIVGGLLAGSVSLFAVAAPAYAINDLGCQPTSARRTTRPPWATHWAQGTRASIFHTPKWPRLCPVTTLECFSTGALGQRNSNAIGTCPNSLP